MRKTWLQTKTKSKSLKKAEFKKNLKKRETKEKSKVLYRQEK